VVVAGLGEHWHADRIRIKPYPCNYFTHAGVECALALRAKGIRPGDVAALELGVAEPALRTIAEPAAAKAAPASGYAAAFSGPYTVAAALAGGTGLGLYLPDFTDDAVRRPDVRALAGKVACRADAECTALFPERLGARLRVTLLDGSTDEVFRFGDRTGPAHGLDEAEVATKFALNSAGLPVPGGPERLRDQVLRCRGGASARSVTALLRSGAAHG
jgi:2-methylcitrate dehydratase PrpD